MIKQTVEVTQEFEVEVDETKFTEAYMEEFREMFYPFYSIDDHMMHIAQLFARGVVYDNDEFVEGYGILSELGIKVTELGQMEEIL